MTSFQSYEVPIGAPVEILSDGSIKFQNDLKNIPDQFVEIIYDLHDIDLQATKWCPFTPFDKMVLESVRYESKGVLFLASHPIEWININQLALTKNNNNNMERNYDLGRFRWSQRYSIGISDPRLVGEPEPDRQSKFRQINLKSSKNGLQWKGNDYGTGLKDALSNDQDIARLVREVGALEIHNFSHEYQGWVIEGGRHCRKLFNSGAHWNMLNKIAQRLLEVDITSLISPGGKDVDEDAHGEELWAMWGSWFALTITFLLLFRIFIPWPSSTALAFVGDESPLWYVLLLFIIPIGLIGIFHMMVFLNPFLPHSLWRSFGSLLINLGIKSKPAKLIGLSLIIYLFIVNVAIKDLLGGNDLGQLTKTGECRECDLSGANLTGADLTGADLIGANLYSADLSQATMAEARLNSANLGGAILYKASLTGANLFGVDLDNADLSGANLTGADLTRANLTGADLTRANLTDANLFGADLTGVIGADFTGALNVPPKYR
jgi:hypothetical protein